MEKQEEEKLKEYIKNHNIIPQDLHPLIQEITINDILKIIKKEEG